MRIVSSIEYSWAKKYLDKMKNINLGKLAGIKSEENGVNDKRKNEVSSSAAEEDFKK